MESKCSSVCHSGSGRTFNKAGIGYWSSSSFPSAMHNLSKAVQTHTPENDHGTLEDILRGTAVFERTNLCQSEEREDRSTVAAVGGRKPRTAPDGSELAVQGAY